MNTRVALAALLAASSSALAAPDEGSGGGGNGESLVTQAPPVDLSLVVGARQMRGVHEGDGYEAEANATLFITKNRGRWQFHAKINANLSQELDRDGLAFVRAYGHLTSDFDAGWVNYRHRDWIQVRAGQLYIPTYWGTRRFQASTPTVADPMIDQNIFPAALTGLMIHGDRFFETGGVSYALYGGKGLESDPVEGEAERVAKPRVWGAKLTAHLPSRGVLDRFDVSYHRMRGAYPGQASEWVDGGELLAEKGRLGLLADVAHARMRMAGGGGERVRFGYYGQPSFRINPKLTLVARYDNALVALDDEARHDRGTIGFAYRPRAEVQLKADLVRNRIAGWHGERGWGASVALVWFVDLKQ